MATKTLSQLVGGGGREVGELVPSVAASLADGKVLLDCDGSAFNVVTYPALAAIISATRGIGEVKVRRASNGQRLVHADHFAVSPDGTQVLGIANENFITSPAGGSGILIDGVVTPNGTSPNANDDNCSQCYFSSEANKGYIQIDTVNRDFEIRYATVDGTFPGTNRVVDTLQLHDTSELLRAIPCGGSLVYTANAQEAIACSFNITDNGPRLYYGNNASGFWADTSWTTGAAPTVTLDDGWLNGYGAANATLAISMWPTNIGMFVSTDTGATWASEGIMMPGNVAPIAVAMDSSNNGYALDIRRAKVSKSTDSGASWTEVFHVSDIPIILPEGFGRIRLRDVKVDSSNRIYVLADSNNGFDSIAVLYVSTDAGASWTHMVQGLVERAGLFTEDRVSQTSYVDAIMDPYLALASGEADEQKVNAEFGRMQLVPDGSKIYVNDRRGFTLYETEITAASYLPYLPGFKIVAA